MATTVRAFVTPPALDGAPFDGGIWRRQSVAEGHQGGGTRTYFARCARRSDRRGGGVRRKVDVGGVPRTGDAVQLTHLSAKAALADPDAAAGVWFVVGTAFVGRKRSGLVYISKVRPPP
jgi:hypothetical protein